jgi:hypothetical protein
MTLFFEADLWVFIGLGSHTEKNDAFPLNGEYSYLQ